MIEEFLALFRSEYFLYAWDAATVSAPVWIPALLVILWFQVYMNLKQRAWVKDQGSVLLEIKVPRELPRSPAAMELFLHALHQTGVGTLLDVYGKGRIRPWFSLELVSIEGSVHFYIWMHKKFKGLIETQLYSQFPDIEVHEVPDYTLNVHHDPDKIKIGKICHMILTQKDAYPIKTYVDYELDRDPKEEFKHDPIVPVLEYLGSLGKGEQAWIQIMIRGHAKEGIKHGRLTTKPDWKKDIEKEIEEIRKKNAPKSTEGNDLSKLAILTKGQQDTIAAMERHMGKFAFDTMIRVTYFAEKEKFDGNNIGGLLGSFRQFSSNTLNGFKPGFGADYDYPWQDFRGQRRMRNERRMLEAYKRRSFFAPPFKNFNNKPFILTTEELATIFHFPSQIVAATPTLSRLPSKKGEAPSNLPI